MRVFRYRRPVIVALILATLLAIVGVIAAQPPVPHAVMEGEDCLSCHQTGAAGAPRLAWDHLGRGNQDCAHCHQVSGAPAGAIPHTLDGRDDCLSCHLEGASGAPRLAGAHVDYANQGCQDCHRPSAGATESDSAAAGAAHTGVQMCISCHQYTLARNEHVMFTEEPVTNDKAGARHYQKYCVDCHGEDGAVAASDDSLAVNSEAYWSTHDNAAILQDIGARPHGDDTGPYAEEYGGPLAWKEVVELTALVRSWGPLAVSYNSAIGPTLIGRCRSCHGGTAGLTVTSYQLLMEGADSGPVIIAGDPAGSLVVQKQREGHYAQLSDEELNTLIEWIANGAPEQ